MDKHFKFGLCSVLTLFLLIYLESLLDRHYLVTQVGIFRIANAFANTSVVGLFADMIFFLLFCFLLLSGLMLQYRILRWIIVLIAWSFCVALLRELNLETGLLAVEEVIEKAQPNQRPWLQVLLAVPIWLISINTIVITYFLLFSKRFRAYFFGVAIMANGARRRVKMFFWWGVVLIPGAMIALTAYDVARLLV